MKEVEAAILERKAKRNIPEFEVHERVKHLYAWPDIARRTEVVYAKISEGENLDLLARIRK